MEEWDPRDVSFITPPCSLHSFSLSFSFSAGLFLFFFFFILIRHLSLLSSIHPVVYHPSIAIILLDIFPSSTRLPTTPKNNLSFFFFPPSFFFFFCCSLSPSLLLLWQSFLGFIISSGDIPPSFSPFSPPSLPPSFSFALTAFSFCPFSLSVPKKNPSFFYFFPLFYVFHLWIKERRCGWRDGEELCVEIKEG